MKKEISVSWTLHSDSKIKKNKVYVTVSNVSTIEQMKQIGGLVRREMKIQL